MENFTNNALNITDLPKLEALTYSKLNSKFLTETLLIRAILALPLGIGVFVFNKEIPQYFLEIILVAALIFIILIFFGYLGYFKKAFALREKDISYKRGIIFNSITTIPLSRIQHSELLREPLDRILGLSSVKIYTAGGSSSDITIPGLSLDTAEKVREFINGKGASNDSE